MDILDIEKVINQNILEMTKMNIEMTKMNNEINNLKLQNKHLLKQRETAISYAVLDSVEVGYEFSVNTYISKYFSYGDKLKIKKKNKKSVILEIIEPSLKLKKIVKISSSKFTQTLFTIPEIKKMIERNVKLEKLMDQ